MDWERFKEQAKQVIEAEGFTYAEKSDVVEATLAGKTMAVTKEEFEEQLQDGPDIPISELKHDMKEWRVFATTKWEDGLLYEALHRVGDDPVKAEIERDLAEEFKDRPEILDRIAAIFKYHTISTYW